MIECKRKLMWEAHERYKKSEIRTLYEAYKNPSRRKWQIYNNCYNTALSMTFYRFGSLKIIGLNSQTFSVGFYGKYCNETVFVYITKNYERYIKLSDLMALEEKYSNR